MLLLVVCFESIQNAIDLLLLYLRMAPHLMLALVLGFALEVLLIKFNYLL